MAFYHRYPNCLVSVSLGTRVDFAAYAAYSATQLLLSYTTGELGSLDLLCFLAIDRGGAGLGMGLEGVEVSFEPFIVLVVWNTTLALEFLDITFSDSSVIDTFPKPMRSGRQAQLEVDFGLRLKQGKISHLT
jgi:hypothetical protein